MTVSRTVAPGRETEFGRWAEQMVERARSFPGSLGAGILHPGPDGGEFQIVFRFVDGLALRLWERSPQRAALMVRAAGFVSRERIQRTVGVDNWFDFGDGGTLSILGLQQFGCLFDAIRFRNVTHESRIQQIDTWIGGKHFDLIFARLVFEPGPG